MDQLKTLTDLNDLIELRELYFNAGPVHYLGYYTLDNFCRWIDTEPQLKHVKVFSLTDDAASAVGHQNGVYLIMDRFQVFLNSLQPNDERLGKALKLLDWSRGYKITSVPKSQYEIVLNTLKEMKIEFREAQLNGYRLPKEEAAQLEVNCPDGMVLRPLASAHAAILDEYWPSQQAGSLQFFERLIALNVSMGLFERSSGNLLGWCTRCQCGFLGTLHVVESHRRRGLAKLVVKAMSREVAKMGSDVYVLIHNRNNASIELFRQLKFQRVDTLYHFFAFRVAKGFEWSEED